MKPTLFGHGGGLGPDRVLEIELFPARGHRFPATRAGEQEQSDDVRASTILMGGENIGEALDLVGAQIPIARDFRITGKSCCRIVRPHLPTDREIEELTHDLANPIGTYRRRFHDDLCPRSRWMLARSWSTFGGLHEKPIHIFGGNVGDLPRTPFGRDDFTQDRSRLYSGSEVGNRPCPVPACPGVYAFYFDEPPRGIDSQDCHRVDKHVLLYVGIAPKPPPLNGAAPSKSHLRQRLRTHYYGNAAGSTLRRTLGCLLSTQLGIQLRRVGSGGRYTFTNPGEQLLDDWIRQHAFVTWVETDVPWEICCHQDCGCH
jgi:hypothetical protein